MQPLLQLDYLPFIADRDDSFSSSVYFYDTRSLDLLTLVSILSTCSPAPQECCCFKADRACVFTVAVFLIVVRLIDRSRFTFLVVYAKRF